MARVIALMALAALGLTEAPVHEPVHDHHSERLMSTTESYHASRDIRPIVGAKSESVDVSSEPQAGGWSVRRLARPGPGAVTALVRQRQARGLELCMWP